MNNSENLLSGIRVIDCGTYIAGPAAATVMSDFGAEVIKIERPPHGDPYRFRSLVPGMPIFGGIMMGLYRRTITGKGMKLFTSLVANGAWSNACGIQAALVNAQFVPRTTRRAPSNPLVNHYVTRDQKRFLTCLLDPKKDWCNLCNALGRPELV